MRSINPRTMVLLKLSILLPIISVVLYIGFFGSRRSQPTLPNMADAWWGRGLEQDSKNSSAIKPFVVNVSDDILTDLRKRILNTRMPESLSGEMNFEYGFHSKYMKEVVEYWLNKYDWRKQETVLNSYPQYMTNIEGIDVHFVHIKPSNPSGRIIRPLMLIHGWPGSFWEFYKIIPMLTSMNASDVSLEFIIPSIPGYGFSEAPHRRGFDVVDAARLFHKLMIRLGHNRYYVHGGDFGGVISKSMAAIYESNVIGFHVNLVAVALVDPVGAGPYQLAASLFPSLFYSWAEIEGGRYMSLTDTLTTAWRETGYLHLHSTRPDSIAYGLNDSPVGLAAHILEKFSVWSNVNNRFCPDGCLTKHFTLDELLTNVMIYWVTGSIGSSMRFYKETFGGSDLSLAAGMPVKVPAAVAAFPQEVFHDVEFAVRAYLENLIQYTLMPRGGHFAAMEQPKLLADDILSFVRLVEDASSTNDDSLDFTPVSRDKISPVIESNKL